MKKALESLENIKHYDTRVGLHKEDYELIEKHLKALEIIVDKSVDIVEVIDCWSLKDYNDRFKGESDWIRQIKELTVEEYVLLCEVLL